MSSISYQYNNMSTNTNKSLFLPQFSLKPSQSMSSVSSAYTSTSDIPTSNTLQAFSNGFKSIVGSGICALPFAFYASGWLIGILALMCVCASSAVSMQQLIACVRTIRKQQRYQTMTNSVIPEDDETIHNRTLSFDVNNLDERLCEDTIGFRQLGQIAMNNSRIGEYIVNISLLSCQLGGNCAFLSFVVSSIYSILTIHNLTHYLSHTMIVILLFPILCGLALSKSTAYLAPFSHFGNITLLISVLTVLVYSAINTKYGISLNGLQHMSAYTDWTGLAIFLGVSAFSVCAHAEIMAVETDSADRKNFHRVITGVMILITISYALFGIIIYSALGSHTTGNILTSLHSTGFVDIVKISMSISVLVMYPMSLIPAVNAMEEICGMTPYIQASIQASPKITRMNSSQPINSNNESNNTNESTPLLHSQSDTQLIEIQSDSYNAYNNDPVDDRMTNHTNSPIDYYKSVLLRVLVVISTCLVTITFNNYGLLVSLVGSIAGGSLSFVLPPYFYWVIHRYQLNIWYKIALTIQILFGLALIGSGLFVAFTV